MKIHLYTICWNEIYMLPYFLRHYQGLVDKIVVFDDMSSDGSLDLLQENNMVEIRPFAKSHPDSYVLSAQTLHNTCWKESRGHADWIIISAIDELLFHPNLLSYIFNCERHDVTAIPALGYQMLSTHRPQVQDQMVNLVKRGTPWKNMSKLCLFKPDKIQEVNYSVGRHLASLTGEVVFPEKDEILNLHYKYIGFQEVFERHQELKGKLGRVDKERSYGGRYSLPMEQFRSDWESFDNAAFQDVFDTRIEPSARHLTLADRWWR